MSELKLTIAIPTYNRSGMLMRVTKSLFRQSVTIDSFRLMVVDNASTDDTQHKSEYLATIFPNFEYIFEEKAGLSNARNAALRNCKTSWIAFLDDDALPDINYVEELLKAIDKNDCDVIAGRITPWKLHPLPAWFLDEYESFPADPHRAAGLLLEDEYAYGGNMALRMEKIFEVGYFNTDFGVRGKVVPFGEDTELQMRIRKAGGRLHLLPSASVAHCAVPSKYTIAKQWQIRFLAGKSAQIFSELRGWRELARICMKLPYRFFRSTCASIKKLLQGKYGWQNAAIDIVGEIYFVTGLFCGWLWLQKHKEWHA